MICKNVCSWGGQFWPVVFWLKVLSGGINLNTNIGYFLWYLPRQLNINIVECQHKTAFVTNL